MLRLTILLFFLFSALQLDAASDTVSVRRVTKGDVVKYTYKIRQPNGEIISKEVTVIKKKLDPASINKDSVSLLISKQNYMVYLLYQGKPIKGYKAVFGRGGIDEDKKEEGDRMTPEGVFKISSIRHHDKWYMFLGINYPTTESYQKFNENKRKKVISEDAKIGGSIGIHGTFNNQDDVINMKFNWTDGCISLKNSDLAELVQFLQVGTVVRIIR